jgi:hypothetical protein
MHRRVLSALLVVMLGLGVLGANPPSLRALAAPSEPPGPDRYKVVTVKYTQYEWWLTKWADNSVVCQMFVDHEGVPDANEVFQSCGSKVYDDWAKSSQPCSDQAMDADACKGYYLQLVSSHPAQKQIGVALPPPQVWITLKDCVPHPAGGCQGKPTLLLSAEEPLPNERILRIEGTVDGQPFHCNGNSCDFELYVTKPEGAILEFWAYSSYGDSSEKFEAQIRITAEIPPGETTATWYVSVLSPQWKGDVSLSCAQDWQSFPPATGMPDWLTTPNSSDELASDLPYAYLAGNLIYQGIVEASTCADGGLLANGAASACGMSLAREKVTEWQNLYDKLILKVAVDTGIPAQLLKSIFSRESQLWPGLYRNVEEAGFGQLTEDGADTTLLWNVDFYKEFCPLVLYQSTCDKNYIQLNDAHQEILRAALVHSVDLACPTCSAGLDLTKLDFSVEVFGQSMLASCSQTGQVILNATGQVPGSVASYPDLWKFTLVNYNAGPGCLTDAVSVTSDVGEDLTWENVSKHLAASCQGAISYVEDISSLVIAPTPVPTATPTNVVPTPTPTFTPIRVGPTPSPTFTPIFLGPSKTPTATPTP